MSGTFNANANAQTFADVIAMSADVRAKLYATKLDLTCAHNDDLAQFTGPAPDTVDHRNPNRGNSVFWKKTDFTKFGGDKMSFTMASAPAGPGARGEGELTGNTSTVTFGTWTLQVDFRRDAVEMTKKQLKFMATGQSVEAFALELLGQKMGWVRSWDMKMALIKNANGNIVRPNGRRSLNALTSQDTMEQGFLTAAKPQLQRIGGIPLRTDYHGELRSPVHRYIAYVPDVAAENIRNSSAYQNALQMAADRGDKNPSFTGRMVDWNGLAFYEKTIVHPDWDDVIGDPCAPIAKLGTAFSVDSTSGNCKLIVNSANTKSLYFQWFPGYDYLFTEDQVAAPDSDYYYAWLVNPDGSVGFVKYQGSANNGNQITLTAILSPDGAGTSTKGSATVGNIDATSDTWDSTPAAGGVGTGNTSPDFLYTDSFSVGAYIIPANANGCPIMRSFLWGQGAALRGQGSTMPGNSNVADVAIHQERDYGFVKGAGYECVYGQGVRRRTDDIVNGYLLLEHTGQHQGLEVPSL